MPSEGSRLGPGRGWIPGEGAASAYAESLELRRTLLRRLGETPEALRDLAISLHNLGRVFAARGATTEARRRFEEGLELARTLALHLSQLPEYTELPGYFERSLAELP